MKKLALLLLAAFMTASLCGCSALLKKEYLSVSEYTENTRSDLGGDICEISDYEELESNIIGMVNSYKKEGRIIFTSYDGNLQSDLAQACWQAKSKTALGSYSVDYMSYDLSRIVTYYEAVVYITYKHSKAEISNIHYVSGRMALVEGLEPELDAMNRHAAFRLNSSTITSDEVLSLIERAYTNNPAGCVLAPAATVQIHPESGTHRIIEIDLDYGREPARLKQMKSELIEEISRICGEIKTENPAEYAREAYNALAAVCTYDPFGELRGEKGLDADLGESAYGAMVEKFADSRGIAVAYCALCQNAGIECILVNGSVGKQSHSWNIIKIGGGYFHVDVSADSSWGFGNSFMKTDAQMQGRYWWNIESYPECSANQNPSLLSPAF